MKKVISSSCLLPGSSSRSFLLEKDPLFTTYTSLFPGRVPIPLENLASCLSQVDRGSRIFQPQFSSGKVSFVHHLHFTISRCCCSCHAGQTISRSGGGLWQTGCPKLSTCYQCGHNTLVEHHSGSKEGFYKEAKKQEESELQ